MAKDLAFFTACATSKTALGATYGVGVYGSVPFVKYASSRRANSDLITALLALVAAILPAPAEDATNSPPADQSWTWHLPNTDIVQGNPGFPTQYSGPNSLPSGGETR